MKEGKKTVNCFKEQLFIALSTVLKILGGDVLGEGISHLGGVPCQSSGRKPSALI